MVHSHESQDNWSSLSSIESLTDLSVHTPPPSKGNGVGGSHGPGFRRLNARTAADIAKSSGTAAAMAERSHRLPSESDIKAERYRYAPSDREIWRPAIEQLSQKISEQQHEMWDMQTKLRDEAHRSDELLRMLKAERKEHKEVVKALTSELSLRRETESAALAEATRRNEVELERAWKRCAELEQLRQAAEENAAAKRQESTTLEIKVNELQTQISGLKLIAAQSPAMAQPTTGEQIEAATADLKRENTDLKDEAARLRSEIQTLRVSSNASNDRTEALEALHKECELLNSRNNAFQDATQSLKATLEAQTQQTNSRVKQAEDEAWQQASHLATEKISEVAKKSEIEISRLNEKTESQAAIITSQKEFLAMANSQLDYMRGLLGDSIGKLLDQWQPSSHSAGHYPQPSPLHPSVFRPSPPPQESHGDSPVSNSRSSGHRPSIQKRFTPNAAFETPKPQSPSPRYDSQLPSANSPANTPLQQTDDTSDNEASSSPNSLSTIEPDSDPNTREWVSKTPTATYPLQQSTVNHSTTTASATSTPSFNERLNGVSHHDKDSQLGVSFLDALYERLAKGKMSREELEDFENIYDARTEIAAERPKLELDARTMLTGMRPHVSRRHAAIVSRMANEMT